MASNPDGRPPDTWWRSQQVPTKQPTLVEAVELFVKQVVKRPNMPQPTVIYISGENDPTWKLYQELTKADRRFR